MNRRTALIIGAGPAGLTAAFELVKRTDIHPIVLEKSADMGGISRTVRYKGNRMDIGGHRFFSKSDRVMKWWMEVMPVEVAPNGSSNGSHTISYQRQTRKVPNSFAGGDADPATDRVMLIRNRKSRIYFLRQFFDYPIRLSAATLKGLGLVPDGENREWKLCKERCPPGKARANAGTVPDQSIRPRAVPDLFQVVYRKSLGSTLQSDQCGMGCATNQGPLGS